MDDVGRWSLCLLFLVVGFFFSGMEHAVENAEPGYFKKATALQNSQKKSVLELREGTYQNRKVSFDLISFLSTTLAVLFSFSAVSEEVGASEWYLELSRSYGFWFSIITVAAEILLILFIVLSVSVVLPKRIFSKNPERSLMKGYSAARVISYLFYPLTALILHTANGISRLFGCKNPGAEDILTEEDIRSMVEAGSENGIIEQEEQEMINNIFDFDDKTASDLMTHRTDVIAVDIHTKISDIVYFAINEGFSRIPVYEGDIDNIKGIIYVKDLLCLVGCKSSEDFQIKDFIRKAIFVPEAKKCVDLFQMFKARKEHIAVVVDDYGGTSGIISMEDLLEAIVGNIQDEYDHEPEELTPIDQNICLLSGTASLEDVGKFFGVDFSADDDTDTIGGLVIDTLERIPEEHETVSVEIEGVVFTVLQTNDQRVEKIRAVKKAPFSHEELEPAQPSEERS